MWLLTWKTYRFSKFATFLSIVGALVRYAAVLCVSFGAIVGLFICGAIGIAFHYFAEFSHNRKWQKTVIEKGYAAKIAAGDIHTAIAVYNANPSESTLKFIASHNAQAAEAVRAKIK